MDYVNSLSPQDRNIYQNKLKLRDGSSFPDPFGDTSIEWINNPRRWPSLGYFDIVNYFIHETCLYSLEETKAFKSMDGYNYAINGHVQEILIHMPSNGTSAEYCALKSKVLPSQRQGQNSKLYDTYVILEVETAKIITTHCTCMAGIGKTCSHAAALCFKVEFANRTGLTQTASTSELCNWNSTAKRKVQPARLRDINFKKPKHGEDNCSTPVPARPKISTKTVDLDDIKQRFPNSVVLKSLSCTNDVPLTIEKAIKNSKDKFLKAVTKSMTDAAIKCLEEETRKQSQSVLWFEHRYGRVTSSTMHKILHARSDDTIVKTMVERKDLSNVPAIKHGRELEEPARKVYTNHQSGLHNNFSCSSSGLILNKMYPFLGASPDGVVHCDCCDKGCLEIKSPYKYKDGLPHDISTDNNFPLFQHNDSLAMKKTHQYYSQVQMHMLISGVKYCDFFLATNKTCLLVRVSRDENFIKEMIEKVSNIYTRITNALITFIL